MMHTDPVLVSTEKEIMRYDYVREMVGKKSNITSAGSLAGNSWRACTMKREGNCSDEESPVFRCSCSEIEFAQAGHLVCVHGHVGHPRALL